MRNERGAERREEDARGPVVDPLTADPDAATNRVVTEETITVCPWPLHVSAPALSLIGISARKFTVKFSAALVIGLLLAFSGCGGDDDDSASAPATTAVTETAATETEAAETETEQESPEAESETTEAESPEDQPGGAGDEEPARTQALFTAENGRITPRVVRVPAFIAIQVELRSKDGSEYGLRFGDVTIKAGGGLNSVSTTIDGLRPGEAIVGKPTGAGNRVRIEATAEPGP